MRYRNRNRYRNPGRRLGGLVILVIILIAVFGGGFGSHFFLPLLMVGLAFSTLIGSVFSMNPRGVYGGIYGFVWFMGLALCFAIGFWPWILLPIVVSALLSILARPIIAALLGLGLFSALNMNRPSQPMYTPPMQPYQPPVQPYQPPQQQSYQSYGEGYQPPPPQSPIYQEGGAQYQYPPVPSQPYEQPQSQYPPQELPPQ
ncbi:MAG: hypothetical protein NVSMB49_26910 [Ktedonobacteraceae bacterium]